MHKNDQTKHLIANITHQAINPLNGVLGTIDNIIDGTISDDRRNQRLGSARAQLEYTITLIRNLAYFAEYGGEEPQTKKNSMKTTVIPQNLIEGAMFFQEQADNKKMKIRVENKHIQNAIKGDPDLLRQVFMNIVDNYIKYGREGCTVIVNHWIQRKTNDIIIKFEGESIPFSSDENIFGLGVRGKDAEGETSSGSGLGLHICKLIVEKIFGGKISAEYISGRKSSVFEIRIPNGFITEGRRS
ncbi:MAG TPA: HAMP domain-containing sensor histidine kinase [Cellvibrionaceae bacterium]|nr:HAMP domain-containing sensor histidine kinase [Cellvibrionaceae bacterium]HNG59110.1 HAMP domain-containing sensor histidine kinase [Cellvibrionaceae bacterium]